MLDVVADLHLHSKYSRAVSPQMMPSVMAQVGKQKGLDILATGDWTHPLWMRELRSQLTESEEGLFTLKEPKGKAVRFLLSVEIACIYSQGGKGRRIHNLVFVPSFETAQKVSKELLKRGCNLSSDGRPIIGLSSKNLLQLLLEIDERSLLIPAHVWTPWFGIYGAMSGFNSLEEAFEDMAPYVYGIETGLSSDPEMNWQIPELANRSILSFSDAHSAPKMGREATVFRLEDLSYENIRKAIMEPSTSYQSSVFGSQHPVSQLSVAQSDKPKTDKPNSENGKQRTDNRILYTIEFYPEEGKYHYSGHRNCNVTMTPEEQRASHSICPVCKRPVTDGVMRRVQELSEKELRITNQELSKIKKNTEGLQWVTNASGDHPPFVRLVPLLEIIAEALSVPVGSPKAKVIFDELCSEETSELDVLLKEPIEKIQNTALNITNETNAAKVAEGVKKVREANIVIKPGYDGVYGVVRIWPAVTENTKKSTETQKEDGKSQIGLF